MTELALIVATAKNRIIGKDNQMPWHLPADLAYFKKITLNKPIIMGRKTFESIGRPLPQRRNIVISRDKSYQGAGIEVVHSVEEAIALVENSTNADAANEIMVIGGGAIYQHCIDKATRLYITHIDADIAGDTQFPAYDTDTQWEKVSSTKHQADEKNAYDLDFCIYHRKK